MADDVTRFGSDGLSIAGSTAVCGTCSGTGRLGRAACPDCDGSGRVPARRRGRRTRA